MKTNKNTKIDSRKDSNEKRILIKDNSQNSQILEWLNNKNISDAAREMTPRERKILVSRYLETPSGKKDYLKIKFHKEKSIQKKDSGFLMFIIGLVWFIISLVGASYLSAKELINFTNSISKYLWRPILSHPIILYSIIIFITEILFFKFMKDESAKSSGNFKSLSFVSKINKVILIKIFSLLIALVLLVGYFIFTFFGLLPLKVLMPYLIKLELWINANQLLTITIVLIIALYLCLNYIMANWLFKNTKKLAEKKNEKL